MAALLVLGAGEAKAEQSFRFLLVPEAHWASGQPDVSAALDTGQVYLYRAGAYRPEFVASAGESISLPAGVWHWVAESEGWVSVASGRLEIPLGRVGAEQTLIWPVVPACRLELGSIAGWQGVERVDALSLDRSTVHPVAPLDRLEVNVPAGRYLVTVYGGRGLEAISAIARCRAGEAVRLTRPEVPTDTVDLLVHGHWPGGAEPSRDTEDDALVLGVHERGSGRLVRLAEVDLRVGSRSSFVVRNLPMDQDLELRWSHPSLRSGSREIPSDRSGAREMEEILWRPRAAVEVPVEYLPLQEHEEARLWISRCGDGAVQDFLEVDFAECRDVTQTQPLNQGLGRYRFEGLDLGWHVVMAQVDDDWIPGLGEAVALQVLDATPNLVELEPAALEELRIEGRILLDGEATVGEVRLLPQATLPGTPRIFATAEDLRYQMTFFAETPTRFYRSRLPETLRGRSDAELRGLFVRYRLLVCPEVNDAEADEIHLGGCHAIHPRSTFSGGGTMDLELSGRSLRVELVDDSSGEPIDGRGTRAGVVARPRAGAAYDTLHFFHGEIYRREAASFEAAPVAVDGEGIALLHGVSEGEIVVVAVADGYRRAELSVAADVHEASLRLERDPESGPAAITLELPSASGGLGGAREPAAGAYLVAAGALGSLPRCHQRSDRGGRVNWPGSCPTQGLRRALVFHPRVPVQAVRLVFLPPDRRVPLVAGPARPVELWTRDLSGLPAPREPVDWRIDGILLNADTALRALSASGSTLPFRTDAQGRLDFLATAGAKVEARPRQGDEWTSWIPGEPLDLIIP
ncbi:MAG: hypothetical protein AAGD01_04675 [Acidobacteriota bacterium]